MVLLLFLAFGLSIDLIIAAGQTQFQPYAQASPSQYPLDALTGGPQGIAEAYGESTYEDFGSQPPILNQPLPQPIGNYGPPQPIETYGPPQPIETYGPPQPIETYGPPQPIESYGPVSTGGYGEEVVSQGSYGQSSYGVAEIFHPQPVGMSSCCAPSCPGPCHMPEPEPVMCCPQAPPPCHCSHIGHAPPCGGGCCLSKCQRKRQRRLLRRLRKMRRRQCKCARKAAKRARKACGKCGGGHDGCGGGCGGGGCGGGCHG